MATIRVASSLLLGESTPHPQPMMPVNVSPHGAYFVGKQSGLAKVPRRTVIIC